MSEPTQTDLIQVVESESDVQAQDTTESAEIERDAWQTELNTAIEEKRLSDVFSNLYEFDRTEFEIPIKIFDEEFVHKLRAPELIDEIRKEAMSVTIQRNAGKIAGDSLLESNTDNTNALVRFYNGLAISVKGYQINDGDDVIQFVPVKTVVDPAGDDDKEKTLLDYISDSDKIKVAGQIYAGQCFIVFEKGRRIRSIRDRREYIIKQFFGVDEDSENKPKEIVAYHFAEASAKDIAYFDTKCKTSKTRIKREGEPENRINISIQEASDLFDRLITHIQGGTVNGEEVNTIAKGDARLGKIPSRCKTDAVFVYMNFLKS